jgi:DNA-binding response OmpR family regulator
LDINLPDASGTSTLDRLRQVRADVPIIIPSLSASPTVNA